MAGNIKLEWHNDGFYIPEIKEWSTRKYRLVANYMDMFSKSMKDKWDKRVYIDLFAGAGASNYKEKKKIVKGSPLLALGTEYQFDKYIFCEEIDERINALRGRVDKDYAQIDIEIIHGDCNQKVDEIIGEIPDGRKVLSFCFVDPFKLSSLKFTTIERLSRNRRMDFMMLYPSNMEIRRWRGLYLKKDNSAIEDYLNIKDWRKEWSAAKRPYSDFVNFIAEKFGEQMISIGYLKNGLNEMHEIKNRDKNQSLYHLTFFSKDKLGYKLWRETKKYGDNQLELGF